MTRWPALAPYTILVGFGGACAPVSCAHPSFWAHCQAKQGAARPPLPRTSQLRCFLFDPPKKIKTIKLGPPASLILLAIWGKRVLFLCWQNTYRPFWGVFRGGQAFFTHLESKLCIGATIRPKFASFILFVVYLFLLLFSSFIYLYLFIFLILLFLSLLILLVLFFLFLFFSSYI